LAPRPYGVRSKADLDIEGGASHDLSHCDMMGEMPKDPMLNGHRWRQLRKLILLRDEGRCWLCGESGADTVDHIVPRSLGGTNALTNLAAAHALCNKRRGNRAPVAVAVPSRIW
jgi:HNH endonuclease